VVGYVRELDAEGAAVSFQSVAHRAKLSGQWLYIQRLQAGLFDHGSAARSSVRSMIRVACQAAHNALAGAQ
jgi:hypothetical protein